MNVFSKVQEDCDPPVIVSPKSPCVFRLDTGKIIGSSTQESRDISQLLLRDSSIVVGAEESRMSIGQLKCERAKAKARGRNFEFIGSLTLKKDQPAILQHRVSCYQLPDLRIMIYTSSPNIRNLQAENNYTLDMWVKGQSKYSGESVNFIGMDRDQARKLFLFIVLSAEQLIGSNQHKPKVNSLPKILLDAVAKFIETHSIKSNIDAPFWEPG